MTTIHQILLCLILQKKASCLNIKTTPHDQLQVQFEQNKLCVFDAKQTHWADAPDDEPRITLTFKTREVKNGNN